MEYQIVGDVMQALVVDLRQGEELYAEAGAMLFMGQGIDLQAKMQGGLMKGLMRKFLAGETLFMSAFHCNAPTGRLALANPIAGKIFPIELKGNTVLAERNAYLAAIGNVDLSVAFTKRFGAGLFGGEGFILQKISGQGLLFLHAGGNMLEFNLAPGEQLRVDTGCIVSFADSVSYDIEFVGGFQNALFGGEGLFYATLSGPGHVVLQTLPFSRLANRIAHAIGSRQDESKGLAGLAGGVLGNIISGND
ncbi:MAG TPA: TIGR00266 family protein [Thermoanaerobaculia bacterium]|nr:TIGR00266 family protein [Thermoanaerobaculia bacterium]